MEKQPLTSRQREILTYLETFTQEMGYPPTVREICKATGLKSPRSVSQHLQALERKGYIERGRDKSRAIRFLHKTVGSDLPEGVIALPLKGTVAAGPQTTGNDTDTLHGEFFVDRQLGASEQSFMMRVEGDSMIDAHIVEGDYIVVNPDEESVSGDIVVAKVGDHVTVKRYEVQNGRVLLIPENPEMGIIETTGNDVEILGKVVGLLRRI